MPLAPDEFLNPKSMVTPGIAGGITMLIANSVATQFEIPQKYIALAISALFSILVIKNSKLPRVEGAVYFILNSLLIFSVAVGTNSLGSATANAADTEAKRFAPPIEHPPTNSASTGPQVELERNQMLTRDGQFFNAWF